MDLLDPKDEDTKLLQNFGNCIYMVSCHRTL